MDKFLTPKEQFDIDFYDVSNENSMINKVPPWLRDRLLSKSIQALHSCTEQELKEFVKPTTTLNRLRTAFWLEYERVYDNARYKWVKNSRIGLTRMCSGICTTAFFMNKIVPNDYLIAWITLPPVNYEVAMQEALQYGIDRLREILDFPLYETKRNSTGKEVIDPYTNEPIMIPNTQVANIILKTVALLDLRVKGTVPQKIHSVTHQQIDRRSVNVNATANSRVTVDTEKLDEKLMSIDDLDARIAEIQNETHDLMNRPLLDRSEQSLILKDSMDKIKSRMVDNE